jgi:TP901 family phage tail tape measure protein
MPLNTSGHVVVIDVRVGPGAKTAGAALDQTAKSTKQAAQQAKQAQREFASLAGAFTALFAAGMVKRGFEALIRPAVDFSTAMTRLKGVTKASDEDVKKFRNTAIEVAKLTPYGPRQMVETLTELRRATGDTDAALASLNTTATLSLASFGKMGLEGATRMTTETIKAFGLKTHEVADAMDRLAAVSLATGTGIENFERTIARLGTVATVTGQSFDEMMMLAALAGRGVAEPTRNVRLLSSALKMLQQDKARGVIENELGVQVIDPISGSMRRASTIFTELAERMQSDPVKVRAAMVAAFGQRGGESVGAILNQLTGSFKDTKGNVLEGAKAFGYLRNEIKNSGGALETLRTQWEESPAGILEIAAENVQNLGRALGGTLLPALGFIAKMFGTLAKVLSAIVDNPVGRVVFGILGTGVGLFTAAVTIKALWFGISKIFLNAASNIGLVSVAAGKATWNLRAMASAGAAAAVGASAAAGAGAAGAGAAGGRARALMSRVGRVVSTVPLIGTALLGLYEGTSAVGTGMGKRMLAGEETWFDTLVTKAGALFHRLTTGLKGTDTVARQLAGHMKNVTKETELAKQKAKDMTDALQVGSKAWRDMLSEVKGLADWKPAVISGRVFAAVEARLGVAAGRLRGADKTRVETAMASADIARGLIEQQRKKPLTAVQYKQLNKALGDMGIAGRILNATYGPSMIGAGLMDKFKDKVQLQAIAAGSPESIAAARRWAQMGGMKHPGRETQIPGTSARAGGYGTEPPAALLEDYPVHRERFMGPGSEKEARHAIIRAQIEQYEAKQARAVGKAVKEAIRGGEPLKVQVVSGDPLGAGGGGGPPPG